MLKLHIEFESNYEGHTKFYPNKRIVTYVYDLLRALKIVFQRSRLSFATWPYQYCSLYKRLSQTDDFTWLGIFQHIIIIITETFSFSTLNQGH